MNVSAPLSNERSTDSTRTPDTGDGASNWANTPMTDQEVHVYFGIQQAMAMAHETAWNRGWYKDPKTGQVIQRNFGEIIALVHSEVSEALEAHRKDLPDDKLPHRPGVEVEFADAVIRILDTCYAHGFDLAGAVIEKNRYNRIRADHKLSARAAGGKKY